VSSRADLQPGDSRRAAPQQTTRLPRAEYRALRKRARAAQQLADAIQSTTRSRLEAWADGGRGNAVASATAALEEHYAKKREMRREIYRDAPTLEGSPYTGRAQRLNGRA